MYSVLLYIRDMLLLFALDNSSEDACRIRVEFSPTQSVTPENQFQPVPATPKNPVQNRTKLHVFDRVCMASRDDNTPYDKRIEGFGRFPLPPKIWLLASLIQYIGGGDTNLSGRAR